MNNIKKPKRRRHKDNPYSLLYDGEYEIKLTINGKSKIIKVNQDLYEAFNKFELEDLKEMNEYDRNLTHYELDENSLYNLSLNKQESVEDNLINQELNQELHKAIDELSEIQKQRVIKYYFKNMKLEEIAEEENTSFQAISKSINLALLKLKELLKNKI